MSTEQSNKRGFRWVFLPLSLVLLAIAGYVNAGPHFGGHGMMNPLERMIEHIDLNDQQEEQVEDILKSLKGDDAFHKGFSHVKKMFELNPEDAEYMESVAKQAELVTGKIKQKMLKTAEARQDIYKILDEEQKQELADVINKKMARMVKRMERHRE